MLFVFLILFNKIMIEMNPDHRSLLEIYVTPNLPGSFAGFESFFRSLKEREVVVQEDKRRVRNWMKLDGRT
jgi:hypothetical protein